MRRHQPMDGFAADSAPSGWIGSRPPSPRSAAPFVIERPDELRGLVRDLAQRLANYAT
jgi:hypothetical protein